MATTTNRGYGNEHQRLRAQWQQVINQGHGICHAIVCLEPTRQIPPGTPWDLGHTPDRTTWTGPEHPRCNRSEGGRRGRQRQTARKTWKPKRIW
jgi:hypothetical protein